MQVLIHALRLDAEDVGETMTALKLVREMSELADLTVLALENFKGPPLREQLPKAEVVTWPEPAWAHRFDRLRSMAHPTFFVLAAQVQRWIREAKANGRRWDIAHQITPRAPRYPSIHRKFDTPYVIGSLGGALPTPDAFKAEAGGEKWYARLRGLDQVRFRYDPFLRASYRKAAMIVGVAPYMRDVLAAAPIARYESFLGIGVDDVEAPQVRQASGDRLKLLHVGRAIRTKGLRDAVRALGRLKDLPGVTLTSIGDGEEIPVCREIAAQLGVADRVEFLGRLPRKDIEAHYASSDVFVFPSTKESMGGVLFEAMRWSLPVITVRAGGPDYIVDERCGLKVDVGDPDSQPRALAAAIEQLLKDPDLRARLGAGGRQKLIDEQLWPIKAKRMIEIYEQAISG